MGAPCVFSLRIFRGPIPVTRNIFPVYPRERFPVNFLREFREKSLTAQRFHATKLTSQEPRNANFPVKFPISTASPANHFCF